MAETTEITKPEVKKRKKTIYRFIKVAKIRKFIQEHGFKSTRESLVALDNKVEVITLDAIKRTKESGKKVVKPHNI